VIVLDASVLIAHVDATDSHHDRADELLLLAVDQEQPLGAGPLRLATLREATNLTMPDCCSSPPTKPGTRWPGSMTTSRMWLAAAASPCEDGEGAVTPLSRSSAENIKNTP
jgi:hypothetical protein